MPHYFITLNAQRQQPLSWIGKGDLQLPSKPGGFRLNTPPKTFTDKAAAIEEAEDATDIWASSWIDYTSGEVIVHEEDRKTITIIHRIPVIRFPGLSGRATNICTLLNLRTREEILAAIQDGHLRPNNPVKRGVRGYGWTTHFALHDWLGLPRPPRVGKWITCPHCGELIEINGKPTTTAKTPLKNQRKRNT
jgi:hypothetical protein